MSSFERAQTPATATATSSSYTYQPYSQEATTRATYRSPFVESEETQPSPSPFQSSPFTQDQPQPSPSTTAPSSEPPPQPFYRTCRICLDTTTQLVDPELGRLISPCRCRGTSKYVHVECLQQWRLTSVNSTSYYQCNTCHYRYKLRRLRWGKWISSTALQLILTTTILSTTVYLLGFIADPILNAYLNSPSLPNPPPQLRRVLSARTGSGTTTTAATTSTTTHSSSFTTPPPSTEPTTFLEHMLKGLTSLGLLGFLKVFFALGPSSWWNLRNSGIFSSSPSSGGGGGRGRPGGTGRDRLGQLGWIIVAVGILNFFLLVWNKVRGFTRNVLEKAAEEIVDIAEEEDREERKDQ